MPAARAQHLDVRVEVEARVQHLEVRAEVGVVRVEKGGLARVGQLTGAVLKPSAILECPN